LSQPPLVDSHCHLDLIEADAASPEAEALVSDARANGVEHMLCVCVSLAGLPRVLDYATRHAGVSASVGVHPNEPDDAPAEEDPDVDTLVRLADDPRVVAIGETGLDYFRSQGDLGWQRERFRRHIAAARAAGKPLIVHSRDAAADTLAVLREERADAAGGVMHCFVYDWETARGALDLGFHISFSGIVTFRNAGELEEVARRVPADRLLVETDAPYLAPVPKRGKPNRPAWVRHVAEHVAELRGESVEQVAEASTGAFYRLFEAARRERAGSATDFAGD